MNPQRLIVPLVLMASACLLAFPFPCSANNAQANKMVVLHVRVTDPLGRAVRDVQQAAFQVTEDGAPQKIELFVKEDLPLIYGLMIDASGSLRSQFSGIVRAGRNIINSNYDSDQAFLVRFISSNKIENVQECTTDKKQLLDGLDSLYIEGGQTAILDAVYLSADYLSKQKTAGQARHKVLILVSDGEDRVSYYDKETLFAFLAANDTQIFTIGFTNDVKPEKRQQAISLLTQMAFETGGQTFFPRSDAELDRISREIIDNIRTQYVIGYTPTGDSKEVHKVAVSLTPDEDKRVVITRIGYQ